MDDVKELERVREYLLKKKEELLKQLEELDYYIKILENFITERSFTTADKIVEETVKVSKEEGVEEIEEKVERKQPLSTPQKPIRKEVFFIYRGRPVAWVEIYPHKSIVIIDKEFGLPSEDPLITRFLEPRLRDEMVKDIKEIDEGKRPPEKRFTYIIKEDDGVITSIEMLDFGEEARRRDNLGKIRWVLRKYADKKST